MDMQLPEIEPSPVKVTMLAVGFVRLTAEPLHDSERHHGALVRDVHPAVARRLAIELLQAAEDAEMRLSRDL